jgi:hypothetical protein
MRSRAYCSKVAIISCFEALKMPCSGYQRILGSRQHTDVLEFMNLPIQKRTFSDAGPCCLTAVGTSGALDRAGAN